MTASGGWEVYPETAGFDILAVWKATGHQLGVEAKLQLNAKVADQILPAHWSSGSGEGPDFRAVLVPCTTEASYGIVRMLELLGGQVLVPSDRYRYSRPGEGIQRAVHRSELTDARPWDAAAGALGNGATPPGSIGIRTSAARCRKSCRKSPPASLHRSS
ncbi:hypothetical protein G6F24_015420 [Rhizopus arrhizus]|nr:hypothetical protein G6F24_015420 [Rhizopus arrhizus]